MVTKICIKNFESKNCYYAFREGLEYSIAGWNDIMHDAEVYEKFGNELGRYVGRLTLDEIRENFI